MSDLIVQLGGDLSMPKRVFGIETLRPQQTPFPNRKDSAPPDAPAPTRG